MILLLVIFKLSKFRYLVPVNEGVVTGRRIPLKVLKMSIRVDSFYYFFFLNNFLFNIFEVH